MKHKKGYQSLRLIKDITRRNKRQKKPVNWMVTGGIAVDAHDNGLVDNEYRNIDLMTYRKDSKKFNQILEDCGVVLSKESSPRQRNVHGTYEGIDVDVIVLYYVNRIGYFFETPYHNPGAPIPKKFLASERVKIKHEELGNVNFPALNATALYLAKITVKDDSNGRDQKDALRIAHKVDAELREKARVFARPC